MKTTYRWALSIFSGVSALVGWGILYQNLLEKKEKKRFPPPGQLFDVGGARLHMVCRGQGSPTVVLETGLSCTHLDWSRVMPAIASHTRVVAYDRAGYGWSGPGQIPRTGLRMVTELHTLLHKAGISAPIILVGHSYGGLLVRLYASQYPQEVAGLILVDGSPEDQRRHFPPTKSWRKRILEDTEWQIYRLRPILARMGWARLRKQPNGYIDALPEEVKPVATALGLQSGAYDWLWTEEVSIEAVCEEVRNASLSDRIQSAVLAAEKSIPVEEYQKIWLRLQQELSQKLPNCTYEVVEESGHFIHLEKPERVIAAILGMMERVGWVEPQISAD